MSISVLDPAQNAIQRILVSDIRVDDALLNLSTSELKQVTISNRENQHDQAVITTQLSKSQMDAMAGKTVAFQYGPRSKSNQFFGYVLTINPSEDYQTDTIVDITCFGISWPMQSGQPRFLRNTTAPDAAAQVITGYSLGAFVDYHGFSWPALAQVSMSDWEFVLECAARVGFAVYMYQGVVRLVDPLRVLKESGLFEVFIKADDILDTSRALLEFNPTTQSKKIRDNLQPSYGFMEGGRGVLSNPIVKPYRLDARYPIQSRAMADTYTTSWNSQINAWNHQATARINGNATLIPGSMIGVKLSAGRNTNDYDGGWLVRGVDHSLTHNSFQTSLILARDDYTANYNTDFRWFYASVAEGRPRVLRNDGDPANVRWVSSWAKKYVSGNTLQGVTT